LTIACALALCFLCTAARAQNPTAPARGNQSAAPPAQQRQRQPQQQPSQRAFDMTEYGVRIEPDARLIVMMAALDAAGFDPTPTGAEPSVFRAQVRRDQADLDEGLRKRLRDFFERSRLRGQGNNQPTPGEQAARYVSLAYALGPAPTFDAPARTDDLPAGLLDVLDFAPLLREFYRKSGMDSRLASYLRAYREEGDRLRRPTADMVRFVLSYLHTRPITTTVERVAVGNPSSSAPKKGEQPKYTVREHERRFFIVPDLLAAPGAINFRVISDDYYVIVPEGTDVTSAELRRAYLQYVVDPIIVRFSRDISARRPQVKQLLDERTKAGASVTPDVFTAVSRSLVTAAEVRLDEAIRLAVLTNEMRGRMERTADAAARTVIAKEMQATRSAIEDESVARLAEAYENGAVLAFYFADQLSGVEASGFDISNFFSDMIASFDVAREGRRLTEASAARARAIALRKERQDQRQSDMAAAESAGTVPGAAERAALIKSLTDVEKMLQLKDYAAAESRLKLLLQQFQGEPRIFFALGKTSSLWARDTTDDDLKATRLNQALAQYRMAIQSASVDAEPVLVCRAHESSGRILAYLDRPGEAMKEFDTVIGLGQVCGDALKDATDAKTKLSEQR
jgi:hypothetical protein